MKKIISTVLSLSLLSVSALSMAACDTRPVLKVASWVDYIDMGGDDSYVKGSKSLDKEFEDWYYEQTGKKIRVDYIPMQDNENMYTKLDITKNTYDLLCPSEYMIMKMAAENLLEKYPESFFDTSIETNYYAKNVSPYIKNIFDNGKTTDGSSWSDYAAGYMWGTT
ncbi:MAG: spermidine/putrescine ABC transporter substrate-binding protein, partial [Christensenellaceae bacterium]